MSKEEEGGEEPKILFTSEPSDKKKVVQNVNRMSEIFFSLCQYVSKGC